MKTALVRKIIFLSQFKHCTCLQNSHGNTMHTIYLALNDKIN
jgi:hypothetical protein